MKDMKGAKGVKGMKGLKIFCILKWASISLAVFLSIAGCGRSNPLGRVAVSGAITLDGKPLDQGDIEFIPRNHGGVSSGCPIRDGKFSIPAAKGLPPGEYAVCIRSTQQPDAPKTPEEAGGVIPKPGIEIVPPQYNAKTTLRVEVKPGVPCRFDCNVKTQR